MRWNRDSKLWEKVPLCSPTCRSSTQRTWSTAQLIRMRWKRWGSLQLVDLVLSLHSYWALYIQLLYKLIILLYFMGFSVLWSITHFVSAFCLTVWPILYACYVDGSQVHHGNRTPAKDCQWPATAGLGWNRKWITNTHCTPQQINNFNVTVNFVTIFVSFRNLY